MIVNMVCRSCGTDQSLTRLGGRRIACCRKCGGQQMIGKSLSLIRNDISKLKSSST